MIDVAFDAACYGSYPPGARYASRHSACRETKMAVRSNSKTLVLLVPEPCDLLAAMDRAIFTATIRI